MEMQTFLNYLYGGGGALLLTFGKIIHSGLTNTIALQQNEIKEMQSTLTKFQVLVAKEYIDNRDFNEFRKEINGKLDNISALLNKKQDKRSTD